MLNNYVNKTNLGEVFNCSVNTQRPVIRQAWHVELVVR